MIIINDTPFITVQVWTAGYKYPIIEYNDTWVAWSRNSKLGQNSILEEENDGPEYSTNT